MWFCQGLCLSPAAPHPRPEGPRGSCAGAELHSLFPQLPGAVGLGWILKGKHAQMHRAAEMNGSSFGFEIPETFQVISSHL